MYRDDTAENGKTGLDGCLDFLIQQPSYCVFIRDHGFFQDSGLIPALLAVSDNDRGNDVTDAFLKWCRPLIGPELRDFVDFKEEYEKMGVGK